MTPYPVNLDICDRKCAVVGGGSVAWRKVRSLLKAGARVTVISPCLAEPLSELARQRKIVHHPDAYRPGDLSSFFLVICAADDKEVNRLAAQEAKAAGALVNVVDCSHPSDFTVPAQLSRGALLMTVSTGGKSPALSRLVREELGELYGEEYAVYLDFLETIRLRLKTEFASCKQREAFWRNRMDRQILELVKQGKLDKAEAEIRNAIGSFRSELQDRSGRC